MELLKPLLTTEDKKIQAATLLFSGESVGFISLMLTQGIAFAIQRKANKSDTLMNVLHLTKIKSSDAAKRLSKIVEKYRISLKFLIEFRTVDIYGREHSFLNLDDYSASTFAIALENHFKY